MGTPQPRGVGGAGSGDVAVVLQGSAVGGVGVSEPGSTYEQVLGPELSCALLSRRERVSRGGCAGASSASPQKGGSLVMSVLPQVLIFAEKKADVDAIHEYLLLKGVEAVAIHGGKGQ